MNAAMTASVLIPSLIGGVILGSLFGLLGLTIVLLFRTTGMANFAAGAMVMFSSFVTFLFFVDDLGLGTHLGALCGVIAGGALGVVIYLVVMAPRPGHGHVNATFRTLGLFLLITAVATRLWSVGGTRSVDGLFPEGSFSLFDFHVTYNQAGALAVAITLGAGFLLFFGRTRVGLVMRAVASDRSIAELLGIDVSRVELIAWAIAGALAAVVGVLLAPILFLSTDMADLFLLYSFAAVILGGIFSFAGAIVGGLLVGIVYGVSGAYVDPELRFGMVLLLMLCTLLVRPGGLFGTLRPDRV